MNKKLKSKTTKSEKYEMHVISNTHWDREWRFSFQKTRMWLVKVMDLLLNILDKYPGYKCFHLDSQSILLEDYVRIRPDKEGQLKKYIRQGRILAGPWYTCVDQSVVSGESIVRNLLIGHQVSKEFGGTMKVGYTPFSFGQISQLPQIYNGFGIDTILTYRGIGRQRAKAEFWWESPDGTRLLCSQFGRGLRYNFYFHLYRPVVEGRMSKYQRELKWEDMGLPLHMCDETFHDKGYFDYETKEHFYKENILPGLKQLVEEDSKDFTTRFLLFMQGCDTTQPNPAVLRIIDEINKKYSGYGIILHSTLPDYVEKLKKGAGKLSVLKGEMRQTAMKKDYPTLLGDILSNRIYLKQRNAEVEFLLQKWAEPVSSLAWLLGQEYPKPYLDLAWKYLLSNHPHDSIGGCGVDEISDDMLYRFSQTEEISEELTAQSLGWIVKNIAGKKMHADEVLLTVFNSLGFERSGVITLYLDFPQDKKGNCLTVKDFRGKDVPIQISGDPENGNSTVHEKADWPQIFYYRRYKAHLLVDSIPAIGYKCFRVKLKKLQRDIAKKQVSMITAPNTMENEHLRVKIESDGTFTIKDKNSGRIFKRCHYFEDSGTAGNPWQYMPPEENEIITSLDGPPAEISLIESGPLVAKYQVTVRMKVPINSGKKRRVPEKRELRIISDVVLKKGCLRLDIKTTVENNIRDHRLRVCFPTDLKAKFSAAEGQFDVLERPVKLPDTSKWAESASPRWPMLSFVDLSDGKQGIAFIGEGLPEYEVIQDKKDILAVTLLRGISGVNRDFGFPSPKEEGLQCLGEREFRYALYPHSGDWEGGEVFKIAYDHNIPLKAVQSGQPQGTFPLTKSFLRIEPTNLIMTALKKAAERDSLILRVFNPTNHSIKGHIFLPEGIKKAQLVNLLEKTERKIPVKNSIITIDVPKKKIISIELFC